MGKMQLLGVVAVIVAFYSVHAKVYFREEFLDGGKFGCKCSDITTSYLHLEFIRCWTDVFYILHVLKVVLGALYPMKKRPIA